MQICLFLNHFLVYFLKVETISLFLGTYYSTSRKNMLTSNGARIQPEVLM